ncbi:two-component system response regulator YesN [Anaerobacterium chartisolvens]|uniref:Stage 0 sporulation protein A homolog n=1 Tax=Anaerobacterium chartisolvens TaxID=1297424 RepID=A0A369AZW2_9FIRM|nr:response regulator [Anaerobacterium chartisolvens]RCX14819.1 two-component system response regulator YesN [Anaerobacterium chartisolvens]
MFKLLIVDDEEEVREGLVRKIEWSRYNFEIIGEAQNGREALDIIEENTPDLIITDISMPIISGLELCENVQLNYPTVKIVILTGFGDFNYAQQAIRFGVEDYILKPVLPKDIDELLLKFKNKLEQEIEQRENIIKLKEHFNESLPIIRDKFLSLIIQGNAGEKEIKSKIPFLNLKLIGKCFVIAAAGIDNKNQDERIFSDTDTELMRYAVINIAKEIIEKHAIGEALFHDSELVVIFSLDAALNSDDGCRNEMIFTRVYPVLKEIRQNVEKHLKLTVTIGVGSACDSLQRLNDSYRSALSALEYKLVVGESRIIFIEDLEPKRKNTIVFDERMERRLITAVKFGTEKDIDEAIGQIFNILTETKAAFQEYQLYFVELAAAVSRLCRDFEIDTSEILGIRKNLYMDILELGSFKEIKDWLREICIKIMNYILTSRQKTTQMLLDKAKSYVHANYGEEGLSIQKVADYLHISQSYLSMIFKKETDETFLKYLVRVRLNAAMELLQGSYKTAEIAERVGYPDVSYFSYFFKKNFGMSPREYRNKFVSKKEF